MKTLLIIFASLSLAMGASAQHTGGYHHVYRPRVVIVPSVGFGYGVGIGNPYFGNPYLGYPYFGYPYGNPFYENRRMPSELSLDIQSIKSEYSYKIKDARKDKSVGHAERRKEIRSLKAERDQAIIDAQKDFNRQQRRNYQNRGNNNNGTLNQNKDNSNS